MLFIVACIRISFFHLRLPSTMTTTTTTTTTVVDKDPMTPRRAVKTPCLTCGKMVGIFSCRGCSGNFCLRHTSVHRDLLQKSMNEILHHYDQFRRNLQGQSLEECREILMEQINRWEEQSIEKIRQLARETRQQLMTTIRDQNEHLKDKLGELKGQIDLARQDGGFYENDLKEWSQRLQQLQRCFIEQQTVQIDAEMGSIPFIPRISLRIFDNDRAELNSSPYEVYSPLKEKDAYSSGKHLLRFKIEEYQSHSSVVLGITSKTVSNISNPYRNPTFYGWTEKNRVYLAGVPQENFHGYRSDFRSNDTYILTIDCNQEMINLTNTRTNRSYDLQIDLRKCPFPWELNVHLFNDGE